MKTLTRRFHGFWRAAAGAAALTAFLVAPAAFQAEEPPTFSHVVHLEEGVGCTDCHDTEVEEGLPTLKLDFCENCHDDGAPGTKLVDPARRLKMKFPHSTHVDAAECTDCHQATTKDTQKPDQPLVTVDHCFACHEENGVETPKQACKVCHGVDQRHVAPPSHGKAWKLRHGHEAEWNALDGHGQDCHQCHTESACKACHQSTPPKSHNSLWRIRTHGRVAAFDRDSCKTCHETGTCLACHRRTPPANHRGAWIATHGLVAGSRMDQSCTVCHSQATCDACHNGGR